MQAMIPVGIAYTQWIEDLRAVVRHELQQGRPPGDAPNPADDAPLTVRESAQFLNVTVQTIHEHKRRGILKYHKLGARTYFKRADLLSALQGHQRSVKPGVSTNKKGQ